MDHSDSYEYDSDITGILVNVTYGLGPSLDVYVREDSGRLYSINAFDLPTPDDVGREDFWTQFIGRRVRIQDRRRLAVEILTDG